MKRKNLNAVKLIGLIAIIFAISVLTVIQPFSKEVLSNSKLPNDTTIFLENEGNVNVSTGETTAKVLGPTNMPTGSYVASGSTGAQIHTGIIYPAKIGTITITNGGASSVGTIGR